MIATDYRFVTTPEELRSAIEEVRQHGFVGFDTETTALDPYRGRLRLLQLATPDGVRIIDLDRFADGEEVTPETLKAKGLVRSLRKDVKLLGVGELSKALTITVHAASATAREKVEAAGGTLTLLREPKPRREKNLKRKANRKTKDVPPAADDDQAEGEG